jgi:hypothetical protein
VDVLREVEMMTGWCEMVPVWTAGYLWFPI